MAHKWTVRTDRQATVRDLLSLQSMVEQKDYREVVAFLRRWLIPEPSEDEVLDLTPDQAWDWLNTIMEYHNARRAKQGGGHAPTRH